MTLFNIMRYVAVKNIADKVCLNITNENNRKTKEEAQRNKLNSSLGLSKIVKTLRFFLEQK